MPTSSSSLSKAPLAEEILDVTKQFFKLFGQRKVVRHEATYHQFANFLPSLPKTICSQCPRLIFIGQKAKKCAKCNLVGHEQCLEFLRFKCATSCKSPLKHCFRENTFKQLTCCKHCGLLLYGISRQGLTCETCGMNIHNKCQDLICSPCRLTEDTMIHANVSMKDFDLVEKLGSGSFSDVYKARMRGTGRKFALKVVDKTNPFVVSDPESILTEMSVLQYGKYHPFLTTVHCCFQTEKKLYFVMECVDGWSLSIYLEEMKKFTEVQAKFYSSEIALAVKFLHDKGVVHRDIKLENVIIGSDGHCKLTDFGLSKFLDQTEDMKTRTFCGTTRYISPEVIMGLPYSFSRDWWALGVLMYELLNGCSPFLTTIISSEEDIHQMIVQDHDLDMFRLSEEAESLLKGLLTKEPEKRFGWPEIEKHPFFLFKDRYGSEEHQWNEIELKQIKPPSMLKIEKSDPKLVPPREIIDDVNTVHDPSGPLAKFIFCDETFAALIKSNNLSDKSHKPPSIAKSVT